MVFNYLKNKAFIVSIVNSLLLTNIIFISVEGSENQTLSTPDSDIIDMIQQINESMVFYYHMINL